MQYFAFFIPNTQLKPSKIEEIIERCREAIKEANKSHADFNPFAERLLGGWREEL